MHKLIVSQEWTPHSAFHIQLNTWVFKIHVHTVDVWGGLALCQKLTKVRGGGVRESTLT